MKMADFTDILFWLAIGGVFLALILRAIYLDWKWGR